MANNKVIYNNQTLIDLTSDTATAADVLYGKTFHLASGASATGSITSETWTFTLDDDSKVTKVIYCEEV